jgi:hypothetical protein
MTASLCHRGASCEPRSASAAVREHALPRTGRDLDDRGFDQTLLRLIQFFQGRSQRGAGRSRCDRAGTIPATASLPTASRAASCVRLKRCSPKGTQLQMQSARLPSGTSVPRSMPDGKVRQKCRASQTENKTTSLITQHDGAARRHAHPRNRRTQLHRILGRAVHARGSGLTLRNQRRLGRGLRIPWHFRMSGHNRR